MKSIFVARPWMMTALLLMCTSAGCQVASDGLAPEHSTARGGAGGGGARLGEQEPGIGGAIVIRVDASTFSSDLASGPATVASTPTQDANCGIQTSTVPRVPADVMLVFDASTSMAGMWRDFTTAVMQTVSKARDIRWGLKLYPSRGLLPLCEVNSGVEVSISASATRTIETELSNTAPAGFTPTGRAIQMTTAYLQTVVDQSRKAILLATDGEPNCDSDVPTTVKAIEAARAAGFPVYVVGVGASVGNLDNFAQAGGTAKYYPAASSKDLADALESIAKAVASCTFALTSTPPDVHNVAVYLDKTLVPKDTASGWSLDAGSHSVTLTGAYCDRIRSGNGSTVQVLFGCPGYVAPTVIP